jgi:hypothetical protein
VHAESELDFHLVSVVADRKGVAYTFLTRADRPKANGLIDLLQRSGQDIPQELRDMYREPFGGGQLPKRCPASVPGVVRRNHCVC